jgi:hypothetical protein
MDYETDGCCLYVDRVIDAVSVAVETGEKVM